MMTMTTTRVIHVATDGVDSSDGSGDAPLSTINAAAQIAAPGDTVCIHDGIYRESVHPLQGGISDSERITYEAAEGAHVEIRGSELVTGWTVEKDGVWKVSVENAIFGGYNPFATEIHGDWFWSLGRPHHTGFLIFKDSWFMESICRDQMRKGFWYAEVGDSHTDIYAHFGDENPNAENTEISVRETVFYPRQTGTNYITIRGLTLRHAATNWASATAEQIGLIGTNWSKGWIIENNTISHSKCVGVALGKHGDEFDNTSGNKAKGYVKTIDRAIARGWSRENIGSHIVRNNLITNCERNAIAGSL
ncbi:MAG: hypothetical protein AAF571_15725, partial [Verrucomicrobiota bacterium]